MRQVHASVCQLRTATRAFHTRKVPLRCAIRHRCRRAHCQSFGASSSATMSGRKARGPLWICICQKRLIVSWLLPSFLDVHADTGSIYEKQDIHSSAALTGDVAKRDTRADVRSARDIEKSRREEESRSEGKHCSDSRISFTVSRTCAHNNWRARG